MSAGGPRLRTALAGAVVAAACALAGAAGAQPAPDFVWVQFAADGKPHVRAIVSSGTCPSLAVGASITPLNVRAAPGGAFPDTVCDLVLPPNTRGAKVGSQLLPPIPRSPRRIAVIGDTGCRGEVAACGDPAAWPFPVIAKDIAADRPDLILHAGDYEPRADGAAAWVAEFFAAAKPMLAVAPLVSVRGDQERCDRAGTGWSRYLSGLPDAGCTAHEPVTALAFDDLLLGVVDDAALDDGDAAPAAFLADEQVVNAAAAATPARAAWVAAGRAPIAYEAAHQTVETNATHLGAIVSGHIALFAAIAIPFAKEPPQMILGTGGEALAPQADVQKISEAVGGLIERRFGYALFEPARDGWTIEAHDVDGSIHRRCTLAARNVTCTRVLNAPAPAPSP